MKWFGEKWAAPICEIADHVPTPTGECFANCGKPIVEGDRGIVTPFHGGEEDPRTEANFHLKCFLSMVGLKEP